MYGYHQGILWPFRMDQHMMGATDPDHLPACPAERPHHTLAFDLRQQRHVSLEYGANHLVDAALDLRVVGEGPDHGYLTGLPRRDPLLGKLAGVDEEAGAHALAEAVLLQVPHLLAQLRQVQGDGLAHAALVLDDAGLYVPGRVAKLDGDEALAG